MNQRTMNKRFTALTLALVSALAVLACNTDATTRVPGPPSNAVQSLSSTPVAAASPGGGQNTIALRSAGAGTTVAELPGSEATPANIQGSAGTMEDFLVFLITDIDAYWSAVWETAGIPDPQVNYAFPAPGESVATRCGSSDDLSAFYCPVDDQIVVSQSLAARVWDGTIAANQDGNTTHETGDFSVAYVVAHEFAHSLQAELSILRPDVLVYPTVRTELQADCWAGVWANSAEFEGILDSGDIQEAAQTALDLGDYAIDDPMHHGTPDQRTVAFLTGYDRGEPGACDGYLMGAY